MTDFSLPGLLVGRDIPAISRVSDWVGAPSRRTIRRGGLAVALVVIAYHYTLSTLLRTLKTETPLAYLGLVPFIALLLAAAKMYPDASEPAIHDRQVDYIIGLPMLVTAIAFNLLMPVRLSTMFWLWRLDVLSLPLFAAGTITLLFGVRTLWRLKVPVLFLILAWPLPYTTLLVSWLSAFTNSTLAGLDFALRFVHIAVKEPGGSGSYLVLYGKTRFPISIASACSGVNGIVGYLLVAVAFLVVVAGGWVRKLLWLTFGLGCVWLSNVVRILIIVMAGHLWGEAVAVDILHPFLGLVTFNIVVLAMVLLMRRFGLQMRKPSGSGGQAALSEHIRRAVPKWRLASTVVLVLVLIGALANSSLKSYDLVFSSLGSPRLAAFTSSPSHPDGWVVRHSDTYTWAKPFFGNDSTWLRYQFTADGTAPGQLHSTATVLSDVINTSDVSSFSTYGIEACYAFHGYKLHSIKTVDLGGGVTGNVLSYFNAATHSDWTTVYWHWPVRDPDGKTRYERITLMMLNTASSQFSGPPLSPGTLRQLGLSVQNSIGGHSSKTDATLDRTRSFLVEFAHEVITHQRVAAGAGAGAPAGGAGAGAPAGGAGAGAPAATPTGPPVPTTQATANV